MLTLEERNTECIAEAFTGRVVGVTFSPAQAVLTYSDGRRVTICGGGPIHFLLDTSPQMRQKKHVAITING